MAEDGFHSWGVKINGCPSDNCISIFWLPGDFFGCPGRTDNRNFERWYIYIYNLQLCCNEVFIRPYDFTNIYDYNGYFATRHKLISQSLLCVLRYRTFVQEKVTTHCKFTMCSG